MLSNLKSHSDTRRKRIAQNIEHAGTCEQNLQGLLIFFFFKGNLEGSGNM